MKDTRMRRLALRLTMLVFGFGTAVAVLPYATATAYGQSDIYPVIDTCTCQAKCLSGSCTCFGKRRSCECTCEWGVFAKCSCDA